MDIYSHHRIPFNLGVWARNHKFHPTAVKMARGLKLIAEIDQKMLDLEQTKEDAEQALRDALAEAEENLATSKHGY
jgi:hypothetical protein